MGLLKDIKIWQKDEFISSELFENTLPENYNAISTRICLKLREIGVKFEENYNALIIYFTTVLKNGEIELCGKPYYDGFRICKIGIRSKWTEKDFCNVFVKLFNILIGKDEKIQMAISEVYRNAENVKILYKVKKSKYFDLYLYLYIKDDQNEERIVEVMDKYGSLLKKERVPFLYDYSRIETTKNSIKFIERYSDDKVFEIRV